MAWICTIRFKTSGLILGNTFWTFISDKKVTLKRSKFRLFSKDSNVLRKSLKIGAIWLINTVWGYKKGSKTKNSLSFSKNIMFQLSNALSIVSISLKLVEISQIEFLSVAPAKGHETLPSFWISGSMVEIPPSRMQ